MNAPARPTVAPWLAGAASACLPGLGQLLAGATATGWSLLCMAAGTALFAWRSDGVSRGLFLIIYLCIWWPAVTDAYRTAAGRAPSVGSFRKGYVIWMLLLVGPFALTLLWSHPSFTRRAKWGWTIAICTIVLLFIATLGPLSRWLEDTLRTLAG